MAGKKGSTHYKAVIKDREVRMILEEKKTNRSIAEELGIRDSQQIKRWEREFRREGELD